MSRIIRCTQQDDLWLAARVGRITGSRLDDILASPTTRASTRKGVQYPAGSEAQCRADYRHDLVIERIYWRSTDKYVSQYMKDGSDREPFARQLYEAENQVIVEQVGFLLHDDWDWFGCSPDGLVGDDGGLELKCPNESTHDSYLQNPDLLVQEYKGQCLAGLICERQREWWDLMSFNPYAPRDFMTVKAPRFHRSDWAQTITEIEDKLVAFNAEVESEIAKRGLPPTVWRIMPSDGREEAEQIEEIAQWDENSGSPS